LRALSKRLVVARGGPDLDHDVAEIAMVEHSPLVIIIVAASIVCPTAAFTGRDRATRGSGPVERAVMRVATEFHSSLASVWAASASLGLHLVERYWRSLLDPAGETKPNQLEGEPYRAQRLQGGVPYPDECSRPSAGAELEDSKP